MAAFSLSVLGYAKRCSLSQYLYVKGLPTSSPLSCLGSPKLRARAHAALAGRRTFGVPAATPEGNFLVQKLCRFKNIVPFNKSGLIGRVRQAL